MGSTVASVWSSNDQPPFWMLAPAPAPVPGEEMEPERRFCCPYCPEGPQRGRFRSHLRRHYRAAVRAMVRGGLAPRARLAVLRAAAFRDSREARRRIRRDRRRRRRGMMVALPPNHAFWAAHRLRGTHPAEIDFLGLGLGVQQGAGMLDLPGAPPAAGISSGDVAASANAPVPAPAVVLAAADDDGEESVGDQAEEDVDGGSSAGSN
uniref:Uncharacterized protein n=1 Tax=Oryza meridionalis TaxID=40149 RepID=A0A0E0CQM2_9ORYZ